MVSSLEKEKTVSLIYQSQSGEEYTITGNELDLNTIIRGDGTRVDIVRLDNKYLPRNRIKRIVRGNLPRKVKLDI